MPFSFFLLSTFPFPVPFSSSSRFSFLFSFLFPSSVNFLSLLLFLLFPYNFPVLFFFSLFLHSLQSSFPSLLSTPSFFYFSLAFLFFFSSLFLHSFQSSFSSFPSLLSFPSLFSNPPIFYFPRTFLFSFSSLFRLNTPINSLPFLFFFYSVAPFGQAGWRERISRSLAGCRTLKAPIPQAAIHYDHSYDNHCVFASLRVEFREHPRCSRSRAI